MGAHQTHVPYTAEEDAFIIDTMDENVLDVADVLGRTRASVYNRRRILTHSDEYVQIREHQRSRNAATRGAAVQQFQRWTADEDKTVRETLHLPLPYVAELLGRTIMSVGTRRYLVRAGRTGAYSSAPAARSERVVASRPEPITQPVCSSCWTQHAGECY